MTVRNGSRNTWTLNFKGSEFFGPHKTRKWERSRPFKMVFNVTDGLWALKWCQQTCKTDHQINVNTGGEDTSGVWWIPRWPWSALNHRCILAPPGGDSCTDSGFFLPLDEVWYKVQLMLLRLLKFFNLAAFSTESERMGVSAALQRSVCVWLPRKCSPWSPAPAQRCVRGAGGWWAGWRSWIWLPWLRIRPTGASPSTSPPLCNPGSWKESLVKSGDGF